MRAADAGHAAVSALAVGARVARRAAVLPLPVRAPLHHVAITPVPSTPSRPWSSVADARSVVVVMSVNKDRSIRQRGRVLAFSAYIYVSDRSRKLPSLSATVLGGLKFEIDWSTVRVERKPFRGVFSERGRRDATSATRGGTRRVRDRKSLVSARHTRGSVTHRRERPSSGARRSSENRSAPESGRRCTQAHRPARAGVRITTTAMTSHDKVREGELRGCAEAAFRAMRGSSERAMRDCSLIVRYPHGAATVRSYALRRRPAVRRAARQDVRHAVVSRVPRVQSADALESTSSPARSGAFVRDAERVQTFPTRRATPHRGLPTRRDRRVD